MLGKLKDNLYTFFRDCTRTRVLDIYPESKVKPKGHVLVSYLADPLTWDAADKRFRGHSNAWECTEIVRIFNQFGFIVDAISWEDTKFLPDKDYVAVFDIHKNLSRYAGQNTKKIFHVTGSHPDYSNGAESSRLTALRERRHCDLVPRRRISEHDRALFEKHLVEADLVTLIGNEVTLGTFPENIRSKIRPIIATGAWLPPEVTTADLSNRCREFLWFNSKGAVHKGLDLLLEVFARHPEFTLHLVGPYLKERDFVAAYRTELFDLPNIHSHGFLYPGSHAFQAVLKRVELVVSPSCSEGISTSVITCMQAGLVPILSCNCGISLPADIGWLLTECSSAEIEKTILTAASVANNELSAMAERSRKFALDNYNRALFSVKMAAALGDVMGKI